MTFLVIPGVSNECHLCHMGWFSTCRHVLVFKNVWILDYSGFQKLLISAEVFSFLDSSHYRAQADPKFSILLPQPPKYWDYRRRSEWRWWNGYWLVFEGCGIPQQWASSALPEDPAFSAHLSGSSELSAPGDLNSPLAPLGVVLTWTHTCTQVNTYLYSDKHICALRFTHTSK